MGASSSALNCGSKKDKKKKDKKSPQQVLLFVLHKNDRFATYIIKMSLKMHFQNLTKSFRLKYFPLI